MQNNSRLKKNKKRFKLLRNKKYWLILFKFGKNKKWWSKQIY
jgi:hypothetical protein